MDDLAKRAAAEPAPATLSDSHVAGGVSDQAAVRKVFADFGAEFASGLPSPAALASLLTDGFLAFDGNGADLAMGLSNESSFVGVGFTDLDLDQIDYTDPAKITAHVSFTLMGKAGVKKARLNWRVRKGSDGVRRLHGDQRSLNLDVFSAATISYGSGAPCVTSGFVFVIEDFDKRNNGGAIAYLRICVSAHHRAGPAQRGLAA